VVPGGGGGAAAFVAGASAVVTGCGDGAAVVGENVGCGARLDGLAVGLAGAEVLTVVLTGGVLFAPPAALAIPAEMMTTTNAPVMIRAARRLRRGCRGGGSYGLNGRVR